MLFATLGVDSDNQYITTVVLSIYRFPRVIAPELCYKEGVGVVVIYIK